LTLYRLIFLPVLLVLVLQACGFLVHAERVVCYPYQLTYGELPELNRAVHLGRGEPIYVDWNLFPHEVANYPPLYTLSCSFCAARLGPTLAPGRILSLISTLISSVCIGIIVGSLGTRYGAVVAALLFLCLYPVWNWGALYRVDALALGLDLLGVAVFVRIWLGHRHWIGIVASMLLFVAAWLTKQTMLTGAAACIGHLLINRERHAKKAILLYAGCSLVVLAGLQAVTAGQFWRHTVLANANPWFWVQAQCILIPFVVAHHWLFLLMVLGSSAWASLGRPLPRVPILYLIAGSILGLLSGKIGSNINYLLPAAAGLSLVSGLAVDGCLMVYASPGRPLPLRLVMLVLPPLLLFGGLQIIDHGPRSTEHLDNENLLPCAALATMREMGSPCQDLIAWFPQLRATKALVSTLYAPTPKSAWADGCRLASEYVRAIPGDILSEDLAFTVTTGKRICLQPFECAQLVSQGLLNETSLLDLVKKRYFGAVITVWPLDDPAVADSRGFDRPLVEAIRTTYGSKVRIAGYYIYR